MNNKKAKVLFIGPYPPPYSGPEISMKLFLDSSLKDEFTIIFLRTNFRKDNVNKGKFGLSMIKAFFIFFTKLLILIVRHHPVLAYYPVTPTKIGWLGRDALTLIICRVFLIKSIIHMRGSHFKLNYQTFPAWLRWIVRFACKKVSVALVQADYLKEQFIGIIPEAKIKTLYQTINAGEFENGNTGDWQQGKILFVGHLTKAKGYCDLLRALPLVVEECPDAQFYVAGNMRRGERGVFFNQYDNNPLVYEDPFEAEAKIINSEMNKHYHNLGIITGNDKLEHFKNCNVFIMPSYSEGFSRSLLEAMCLGKAIIYTPVGAHKEVMHDNVNGIKVLPGQYEALAEAIVKLIKNQQECQFLGQNNYRYVREKFDISIIAQQFADIINQVIMGKG